MKTLTFLLITFLLVLDYSSEIIAQEPAQIVPGERVRISVSSFIKDQTLYHSQKKFTGVVVVFHRDTLVLNIEGDSDPVTIPFRSIEEIEVRRGQKSNWLTGLAIGAIGGALTFGLIADAQREDQTTGKYFLEGAAVGGLVFGAIGTGIGALIKTEHWEKVEPLREEPPPVKSQ
jgi:hypothetical protein